MSVRRGVRAVAVVVAALLGIAGCTAQNAGTGGSGSAADGFSGSWAELLELTYAQATSDEERAALEDGAISAQEYAYFQEQIVTCLADLGITAAFAGDGALEYSNPNRVDQDRIAQCSADNGIRVIILADTIAQNPENVEENQLVVDCLRRAGLVSESYTKEDLENGVDIREIGQTEGFSRCVNDPYSGRP